MILLMINLILSTIFIFLNHPMTMGFTLLVQTLMIALITGMLNMNFWFSYILFIIMVGGMLVLFIYMTSIASNEMFNYSNKIIIILTMMMISIILISWIMDFTILNLNFKHIESLNMDVYNNMNLTKYFNYPSMIMIFFMIIYLFITLVAVVKITKIEYGPLRQLF
uniref:NADH-ubiquinone oxidoreductase chain 6 n=1 Tax=Staphylinidae sp. BMNH 1274657 TaxID=1796586 RepID=A0A126TFW9_9COLE|nr:NADH dehydrogenase subunit 6 [Staphylinidae sp. BMNH 1274657]